MASKTSKYITSLVDYILDTKPYHSKLTEIAEEYQFFDQMTVKIDETNVLRQKTNPAWLYNFFSGGDSTFRTLPLKQLHTAAKAPFPLNTSIGAFKVLRDEITEMASVPLVFSKKTFDGPGVADVLIERNGNRSTLEPMVEGIDYFQSHGSFQFQVKQTADANTNFIPAWADTRDDDVISTAAAVTRALAHDTTNPASAVSKVKALLLQIQALPLTPAAATQLNLLLAIVATPALPQDYEPLLNELVSAATPVLSGYTGWIGSDGTPVGSKYVSERFSQLSPALYFNKFSDFGVRESGAAEYADVSSTFLSISNIETTSLAEEGDVWTIVAEDDAIPLYGVFSSISGYLGAFTATIGGTTFTSSTVSFVGTHLAQPTAGETLKIKNRNRVVFSSTAPLETWNIIKVNPLAYSRPSLVSTRYGYIQNQTGQFGLVTILDQQIPTGTVILTARADGVTFDLTSTAEPLYTGVATVGSQFNDGRLVFTIRAGTALGFVQGDRFFVDVLNEPPKVVDLDLGYGYDLDSYDNPNLVYSTTSSSPDYNRKVNFVYDTRFTDYNLSMLNLTIDQIATNNRKWRIQAIPNLTRPLATLKKDGSGPTEAVDLQAGTSGVLPDPALSAAPLYETLGPIAANSIPDLRLYYADSFSVQYSDDDFNTIVTVGTVAVGSSYSNAAQGISFDLVAGSKPFVGVLADDGADPIVQGGDVFSFEVLNPPPVLTEIPVTLVSGNVPRLLMVGDDFHEATAANWTVSFTSSSAFSVSGIRTVVSPGSAVPGSPIQGSLSAAGVLSHEGFSFNDLNVHFTVVPGAAGLGAGDKFTFTTYDEKPSYLVHGSVSGWQPNAVVGVPYWNGIIGFEIEAPTALLFDQAEAEPRLSGSQNTWSLGAGSLKLNRVRFDAPNLVYTLTPTPIGSAVPTGWYVSRSDIGAIGYLSSTGTLIDTYVTFEATNAVVTKLQLQILADDFDLWNSQDTVIIRTPIQGRAPTGSDFVLIDKRTTDRLALNIGYSAVDNPPSLAALAPTTIDVRYIDTYTGATGLPLTNTSPETGILSNWIPITLKSFDSITSVSEFSDSGIRHQVISAGSGELIGTLYSTGTSPLFPTEFQWDQTFFEQYLPLNAESNIVTYGSGFNDLVNARITESFKFLIDGGALTTDYLFSDTATFSLTEGHTLQITDTYSATLNTVVSDGPFGGFLPGYDNLPYDDDGSNSFTRTFVPGAPGPAVADPTFLLHFEGDLVDATGTVTFTPNGTFSYEPNPDSAFGSWLNNSGSPAYALGTESLSLGTSPWTIESTMMIDTSINKNGGVLLAKNYFVTEPPSGQFNTDFTISVSAGGVSVSWTNFSTASGSISLNYALPEGVPFAFAITDDGTLARLYVDGVMVASTTSCALQPSPPVTTSQALISIFGNLQGFSGPNPNWGNIRFNGWIDELRVTLGTALYTTASYAVETAPFTTSSSSGLPGTSYLTNLPLSASTYDYGVPLTGHFHEAQQLAGLAPMTPVQLAMSPAAVAVRLADLLQLIGPFLNNNDLPGTTLAQFLSNIALDPITTAARATSGFGYPAVGLGIDITIGRAGADANNPSTEGLGTSVQDALVMMAIDDGSFEVRGFGDGPLDLPAERTAVVYSGALPPVPSPLPGITTYANFETPLAVVGDPGSPADFAARTFEFNFRITTANQATISAMPNPKVYIWLPSSAAPIQVPVVEKIGVGKYRVSVPAATEAKFYLVPGP